MPAGTTSSDAVKEWLRAAGRIGLALASGCAVPGDRDHRRDAAAWRPVDAFPCRRAARIRRRRIPPASPARMVRSRADRSACTTTSFLIFPFNVEMHYLLAMHLRGGPWAGMYLAQLMHLSYVVLAVLAVYAFATSDSSGKRPRSSPRSRWRLFHGSRSSRRSPTTKGASCSTAMLAIGWAGHRVPNRDSSTLRARWRVGGTGLRREADRRSGSASGRAQRSSWSWHCALDQDDSQAGRVPEHSCSCCGACFLRAVARSQCGLGRKSCFPRSN